MEPRAAAIALWARSRPNAGRLGSDRFANGANLSVAGGETASAEVLDARIKQERHVRVKQERHARVKQEGHIRVRQERHVRARISLCVFEACPPFFPVTYNSEQFVLAITLVSAAQYLSSAYRRDRLSQDARSAAEILDLLAEKPGMAEDDCEQGPS